MIRQFADHLLGGGLIRPKDYAVIRLVYRKRGGNWEAFTQGDIDQVTLLEKVVTNWGKKRPEAEPEVELL